MDSEASAHRVVLDLSLPEAMLVLAALRQYMPYWQTASELSPTEQLASLSEQLGSVIGKLRSAA